MFGELVNSVNQLRYHLNDLSPNARNALENRSVLFSEYNVSGVCQCKTHGSDTRAVVPF